MGRHTPLFGAHQALGARCVEFAGWDMPLLYTSAAEEHRAVRERCGLFDVSHMGEIELRGPEAGVVCQELTVNDVSRLRIGDAQYTILCDERGGVLDDLVLARLGPERYLLIVNAANTATDHAWINERTRGRCEVVDRSAECALLALQGPEAERVLSQLTPLDLSGMRPFSTREGVVTGRRALVSRTGYTGEDGFEVLTAGDDAPALWDALFDGVRGQGGLPAGLGARDSLRLEAGLPLCGTDMDQTTTPLEAGLGWVVKLGKGAFVGRDALEAQARGGIGRRLVGLQLDEPGIPRHGQTVWQDGASIGTVTSGARSPTLGTFIGLAYVAMGATQVGTRVAVEIRGRHMPAHVVARPFYRRAAQKE
jgi:aminomethyltransferase